MAVSLPRKLFTTEEYERMIELGIFDEDARIELIKGEIVEMAPIGLRHALVVAILDEMFHDLVQKRAAIFVQSPILLPGDSEPEPDIAIFKRQPEVYRRRRPTAADTLLLIEVADATLSSDRGIKSRLYAEAGVPELWIVNLVEDVIEVYSQPSSGRYANVVTYKRGNSVPLPAPLQSAINVDEVLGEAH